MNDHAVASKPLDMKLAFRPQGTGASTIHAVPETTWWNDAEVRGGPLSSDFLDRMVSVSRAPGQSQEHWLTYPDISFREIIEGVLSKHRAHPVKDNWATVYGSLVEVADDSHLKKRPLRTAPNGVKWPSRSKGDNNYWAVRSAATVKAVYVLGIDVDDGTSFEDTCKVLHSTGLFAIAYTTHSHGSTSLEIKFDDMLHWAKKHTRHLSKETITEADIQEFLLDLGKYKSHVVSSVEYLGWKQTLSGVVLNIKINPIDKFRVLFLLEEPYVTSSFNMSSKDVQQQWREIVLGVGELLGVKPDKKATDISRLFFDPCHHPDREGRAVIFGGDHLLDWRTVKRVAVGSTAAHRPSDPARFMVGNFNLLAWAKHFAVAFQPSLLFEAFSEHRVRCRHSDIKLAVECPHNDGHSNSTAEDDFGSCVQDGEEESFQWWCQHDHCSDFDRLDRLKRAIDDGWFPVEALVDPAYFYWPQDEHDAALAKLSSSGSRGDRASSHINDPDVLAAASGNTDARVRLFKSAMAAAKKLHECSSDEDIVGVCKLSSALAKSELARVSKEIIKNTKLPTREVKDIMERAHRHERPYDPAKAAEEVRKLDKSLKHETRPIIVPSEKHQVATLEYFLERLVDSNRGTTAIAPAHKLFRYGGNAVRVTGDEGDRHTLKALNRQVMRDAARKMLCVRELISETESAEVLIPEWLADQAIVAEDLRLLPLQRFVRHPLFTSTGNLLIETGYDAGTKCYVDLGDLDLSAIDLNRDPSDEEVAEACSELDRVFGDFPCASYLSDDSDNGGEGSRAALFALLLMPLVREVYSGHTPIFAVDKPDAGTGASLLMSTLHRVWTGSAGSSMKWGNGDDDEIRKKVTSALMSAVPSLFFDNVHGVVGGSVVPDIATGAHMDRKLNTNEMFEGEVRSPIIFAGNSLKFTDENARRVIPIRLDARSSDATQNRTFRIENLDAYMAVNRGRVMTAAITLIRNWFALGAPRSKHKIASFEDFTAVMGGILETNGIGGFLSGRSTFLTSMKREQAGEIGVYQALIDKFGLDHEFSTHDAFDTLFEDVGNAYRVQYEARFDAVSVKATDPAGQRKALGKKLSYLVGKVRPVMIRNHKTDVRFCARELGGKQVWSFVTNRRR